ncbi:hypothetical protein H0H81_001661 [Sphagnurus paluster]|uniref:Uncharacterized protein n=1 Tax=Sphagnurus paluster TaxID=117069 RepID=A0A9P7G0B1_9AGAR|nr:hypothetical protein H0H81_001661 [Sphagnurus paluster]
MKLAYVKVRCRASVLPRAHTTQAPESKGPKKIDVHLPGPSPKRARRDSDESVKSTVSGKAKKSLHVRTVSSISLGHSGPIKKPASVASVKRSSSKRPGSPDTEFDDGASITDSVISTTRMRRNEAERKEYFKNQPECGLLEEHRAECTRCGKFVSLGRTRSYTIRPWEIHRASCDQKEPKTPSSKRKGVNVNKGACGDSDVAGDDGKPTKTHRTAEERKADLEADPRISVVRPHEVLCRNCGQWIRLAAKYEYKDYNWKNHAVSCSPAVPSTRVATATRKLKLVNDSQVKSFTAREIICSFCETTIVSTGEGDYNAFNWEEHKTFCTKWVLVLPDVGTYSDEPMVRPQSPPRRKSPSEVSTVPFPTIRPSPSSPSTSTEGTLVVSDSKQPPSQGIKRLRDEDEDVSDISAIDPDVRPTNRARIELQESGTTDGDGSSSWLMLPIKAFVRGFKESLKRS